MAGNNLKTRVTADTSNFKKGMRDAKDALKDFEKQGSSALSGIDGLLGTTSGTVTKLADNLKKAGDISNSSETPAKRHSRDWKKAWPPLAEP